MRTDGDSDIFGNGRSSVGWGWLGKSQPWVHGNALEGYSLGSTGSLSNASTPNTHSWISRSGFL